MAKGFEFTAELRQSTGSSESRRLRRLDLVPGTVYGAGQEPQTISLIHRDLAKALENEAVFSHILDLTINGKKEKVVIKALQRHHIKPKIQHIDFYRVKATQSITMNVPIHFIGEENNVALKAGGVLSRLMTELSIKCLPADLPEALELDISQLTLNHSLHLTDIKLPKGVSLAHEIDPDQDHPVASIHVPREESVEEELEVEASEPVEGEEEIEAAGDEKAEDNQAKSGKDKGGESAE